MCFVFIWEQTATCATYIINCLVSITEMKSIYCAVRTGSLTKEVCRPSLKGLRRRCYLLSPTIKRNKGSVWNGKNYVLPQHLNLPDKHGSKWFLRNLHRIKTLIYDVNNSKLWNRRFPLIHVIWCFPSFPTDISTRVMGLCTKIFGPQRINQIATNDLNSLLQSGQP